MRAVVFVEAGVVRVDDVPEPVVIEPDRRGRARHAFRDLWLGPALLPPEGTGGARRRAGPRGRRRGRSGRRRRHRFAARRSRGGGVRHRVRDVLVLPPWPDPAVRASRPCSAPAPSAATSPVPRPSGCGCRGPTRTCCRSPTTLDDDARVFVGDVLTTGFYAASIAGLVPTTWWRWWGWGPSGSSRVQALRALGVRTGPGARSRPRPTRARRGVRCHRRSTSPNGTPRPRSRGHRRPWGRRRPRCGGPARRVRVGDRRGSPWRPGRGRGHVRRRDRGAAARRLLGPGARRPVRRAVPRARLVGTGDRPGGERARSIRRR